MTPREIALLRQFQRRAAQMSPEMANAVLRALSEVRALLAAGQMEEAIRLGTILTKIDSAMIDPAFGAVRQEIRNTLSRAITYAAADLPKGGKLNGRVAVMFDFLNPAHITAVRELETRVIKTMKDSVRETVRAHVENGLRDGVGPRTVARGIRDVVGLAPKQLEAVGNFRKALEAGDVGKAMGYKLRDARYKITKDMTAAQIDKMTDAYRRKMLAFHAETIARTSTLDTLKKGQQLAQQSAIDRGILDPQRLVKTWVQVDRPTKRDEHIPLNGETVPYNSTYSNGEMVPGESTYNCACLSFFSESRTASNAA